MTGSADEISADVPAWLRVYGARTNTLQNLDVALPLRRLCVITGVSGCGKSSLAIDTIAAEGQRRYLEALNLGRRRSGTGLPRPRVTRIVQLPPTVMLGQFIDRRDAAGTLATLSDMWPLWQSLFARAGTLECPNCRVPIVCHPRRAIVDAVLQQPERTKVLVLAPLPPTPAEELTATLAKIVREGYVRARVNGEVIDATAPPADPSVGQLSIDVVIDRLLIKEGLRARLEDSLQTALTLGNGTCFTSVESSGQWLDQTWSTRHQCLQCQTTFPELEPRLFRWTNPAGACPACRGSGGSLTQGLPHKPVPTEPCPECDGSRLGLVARSVRVAGVALPQLLNQSLAELATTVQRWLSASRDPESTLFPDALSRAVADKLLPELERRIACLLALGLGYLTSGRGAATLSHGERQRARLAGALGGRAHGLLFVLDEPTSGLHAQDTQQLVAQLRQLVAMGNSILAVEHNPQLIAQADWILELGPHGGLRGGQLIAAGTVRQMCEQPLSATGTLLRDLENRRSHRVASLPKSACDFEAAAAGLRLTHCRVHNLRRVDLALPLQRVVGIAGVSGSGKSSLIFDGLLPAVAAHLGLGSAYRPECGELTGAEELTAVQVIDRSLAGRSPVATPATLCGVWHEFRRLFARTREARRLGLLAERFSYRHPLSRCPVCQGAGRVRVEDTDGSQWWSVCVACQGRRFHRSLHSVLYRGFRIADVLQLSVEQAALQFSAIPRISQRLEILQRLGLGYLTLGQPGSTLSAGELQRLMLGRHLSTAQAGKTLYLLDEPTAGLQVQEIRLLLAALQSLTAAGHSVVVIEHSLEFLAEVDWLIELGPGSGPDGGQLIAADIPQVIARGNTPTGRAFLESGYF